MVTLLTFCDFKGAAEDGAKGAISGLGQGVMGLVCKPLVGVMDLGSDLVSGIGNTLPSMSRTNLIHSQLAPRRLPRMFYSKMKVLCHHPVFLFVLIAIKSIVIIL